MYTIFFRFRISNNFLPVEKGRWINILYENRNVPFVILILLWMNFIIYLYAQNLEKKGLNILVNTT